MKCLSFGARLFLLVFRIIDKVFEFCVLCKTGMNSREFAFFRAASIKHHIGHFRKPGTTKVNSQSSFNLGVGVMRDGLLDHCQKHGILVFC